MPPDAVSPPQAPSREHRRGEADGPPVRRGAGPAGTLPGLERGSRGLRIGLLVVAGAFPAVYLLLALRRLFYPFELEWMEGGSLDHLRRVLAGEPLYVRPTLDFIPFLYTPFYYYASAPLALLFGPGFLPLRLLSLLASAAVLGLLYVLVRRETGSRECGFLGACLFAACYRVREGWFDLARVDSLFLALLLGAVYLLRFGRARTAGIAAGVLGALAFFTKQTALLILLFPLLAQAWIRRRTALAPLIAFGVLVAGGALAFDRATGGWFSFYVFRLPAGHPIVRYQLYDFWIRDLLGPLGIACAVGLAWAYTASAASLGSGPAGRGTQAGAAEGGALGFYLPLLAGALLGSWIPRLHSGGAINVVQPADAAIAILFGLGVAALRGLERGAPALRRPLAAAAVSCVCLLQFLVLVYNPRAALPTGADARAGRDLVARIAAIPGDVFVPAHGYLAERAGKHAHAHQMAIEDVLRGGDRAAAAALRGGLEAAVRERRFAALILDNQSYVQEELGGIDLKGSYARGERLFADPAPPRLFRPVSGIPARPDMVFLPEK